MKKRVLLVDDDFAVLAGLAGVLVSEGYSVIHALDGEEAITKFRGEGDFDIVLLDLNMPKKNGWDAFEQITAIHPLVPVIVITARPDQYATAVAAGVGALMEKPLDLPILLQKMEELVHESAQARLARRTGRNPGLAYCPAPKDVEGEVFGQVINRSQAMRRPWDRSRAMEDAPLKIKQPLDRLLEAWRSCTREERQLFLDGMKWFARHLSHPALSLKSSLSFPADSGKASMRTMAEVDLLAQIQGAAAGDTSLVMDGAPARTRDSSVPAKNQADKSFLQTHNPSAEE